MNRFVLFFATCVVGLALVGPALADGTETLGAPGITLAAGTGVVVAGAGTEEAQPGTFAVNVPGAVKQVLLYWGGHFTAPNVGDPSVLVGNATPTTPVTGVSIGGPECFFGGGGVNPCDPNGPQSVNFQTYRADITGLGLVHQGSNVLSVAGLDFHARDGAGNDGAGVVVIYDDGSGSSSVAGLVDGQDLAFYRFPSPFDTTVPQTFTFAPSPVERQANLATLATSVQGPASDQTPVRPNQLVVTFDVGAPVVLQDAWASNVGPEFDAVNSTITVPAGASSLTVQALSVHDPENPALDPASFNWVAASLSLPNPPATAGAFTQGFWKNHPAAWPVQTIGLGGVTFTKAQGITLLQTPPRRGNATLILVHQLIAAELNIAGGAPSSCVASTISAANALLAANGGATGFVAAGSSVGAVATGLADTLDQFNSGKLCARSGE